MISLVYTEIKYSFIFWNIYLAIETLPSEIQQQLQLLSEKDSQIEGTQGKLNLLTAKKYCRIEEEFI